MIDFGSIGLNVFSPTGAEPGTTSSDSSINNRLAPDNSDNSSIDPKKQKPAGTKSTQELSGEEIRELSKLKQRDREVKAHEQAHIASGGSYVRSGAKFEYEKGPDGKKYAVGGEVQIDTSKVPGDPEATLRKMQAIRGAAMAPASPSAQDRKVAAQATRKENQARMEILTQRYEEAAALRSDAAETETDDESASDTEKRSPGVSLGGLIDITR